MLFCHFPRCNWLLRATQSWSFIIFVLTVFVHLKKYYYYLLVLKYDVQPGAANCVTISHFLSLMISFSFL